MYKSICRVFFIVLFIGFVTDLSAQIKIGVLGGLNSSKLFGDVPEGAKYKNKGGLYTGFQLDYNVHPSVALSVQPSYSMEGASLYYNVDGVSELVDSGAVSLNYIRIPLLAKINFSNNRFYALAGFDVGLLKDASAKFNNQDEENIKELLIKTDFSFHTGIGYRWHINSVTLFLEGRYVIGLNNISDQTESENNYIVRVKNSGLKILFGVEVPLWSPKD